MAGLCLFRHALWAGRDAAPGALNAAGTCESAYCSGLDLNAAWQPDEQKK